MDKKPKNLNPSSDAAPDPKPLSSQSEAGKIESSLNDKKIANISELSSPAEQNNQSLLNVLVNGVQQNINFTKESDLLQNKTKVGSESIEKAIMTTDNLNSVQVNAMITTGGKPVLISGMATSPKSLAMTLKTSELPDMKPSSSTFSMLAINDPADGSLGEIKDNSFDVDFYDITLVPSSSIRTQNMALGPKPSQSTLVGANAFELPNLDCSELSRIVEDSRKIVNANLKGQVVESEGEDPQSQIMGHEVPEHTNEQENLDLNNRGQQHAYIKDSPCWFCKFKCDFKVPKDPLSMSLIESLMITSKMLKRHLVIMDNRKDKYTVEKIINVSEIVRFIDKVIEQTSSKSVMNQHISRIKCNELSNKLRNILDILR